MTSDKKRRYATRPSQKRSVSFQAYISESESKVVDEAIERLSRRDKRKYSKGEFLMWMFSELFGDEEHTLSQLNGFENDTSDIRDAIGILQGILEKREKFSNELRDYNEEESDE